MSVRAEAKAALRAMLDNADAPADRYQAAVNAAQGSGLLDDADAAHFRAMGYRHHQRYELAVEQWLGALRRGPVNADLFTSLGALLREMSDVARFREAWSLWTEQSPDWARLRAPHVMHLLGQSEMAGTDDLMPAALIARARELAASDSIMAGQLVRWDYRRAHPPSPVPVISLGLHCLPHSLALRWGLRSGPDAMTMQTPFDLAVHKFDAVVDLLRSGFAGYADADQIALKATPQGHQVPYSRRYRAIWNHNKTGWWTQDHCEPLRALLLRKVASFEAALRRPKLVFTMSNFPFASTADATAKMEQLTTVLRQRLPSATTFFVFASGHADAALAPHQRTELGPQAVHYSVPYPAADYNWADEEHASRSQGLHFERGYIDLLKQEIVARGLA